MAKSINRREFIKLSGLGLTGIALSNPLFDWATSSILPISSHPITSKKIPTYCEVCFWKCAGWAHINDKNELWKLTGNDIDPHCNGRFCPRGTGGVGMYYDEDRLKTPLIRKTIDGKQKFIESTWDEAFNLIVEKMNFISKNYGPESLVLFTHGSSGAYFKQLLKAFGTKNITKPYKLTAKEMLAEIQYQSEIISPDKLADWIINNDSSIQLIDIRTPKEFAHFHLENAINIPLNQLLNNEWVDYLDQGIKMNIYYSNGTTLSHEAWMITRQLVYENNYVLQGGLNYWTETILNPMQPTQLNADDEIAKYDFRKEASQYFGTEVGKTEINSNDIKSTKPKVKRKKKKKAPNGSC